MIFLVNTPNVTPIWPQVAALLEPALALVGTHDPEDVRKDIMGGKAHLWVQKDVEMALVTDFQPYPKGVWLRFWIAGALPDAEVDWDGIVKVIMRFAEVNQCAGIEGGGRFGWGKYCPAGAETSTYHRLLFKKES